MLPTLPHPDHQLTYPQPGPVARPTKKVVDTPEDSSNVPEKSEDEVASPAENASGSEDNAAPSVKRKRAAEEDEADDVETRYLQKLLDDDEEEAAPVSKEAEEKYAAEAKASKSSKAELKHESLVHESLTNNTEVEKADSTLFIGNLPSTVITDKSKFKEFKKFLTSKGGKVVSVRFRSIAFSEMLPRKAAFVLHKFHSSRETVNAYAVFDTSENARLALALNGTIFEEHHLRVDSVSHPGKQDNKRSIFVGNLDFEIDEEPLWRHFGECGEIEYVRIVRDSKTNVGKGFGYVQFKDPVAVTKAIMLHEKPLGGPKGRKLRVTRARNIKKTESVRDSTIKNKAKKVRLTNDERTKLGRARTVVGKAGRAEINAVLEGTRASKGDAVRGIKNGGKRKKPRIRERSTKFKADRK